MAWLAGWTYRKTVSITGQAGAGTDYQVDFSIGDGSGGDFDLESHCTSFPNDIQITDNDQTTPLDYWVEDLTVDPIKMWVEVADDLGSNVDICVYYGKSGAGSESNITNTFLFGDGFSGSSLDTDKWDNTEGLTTSVSGGILEVSSNNTDRIMYNKPSGFSYNTAIRTRAKWSALNTNKYSGFHYDISGNQNRIMVVPTYNSSLYGYVNSRKAGSYGANIGMGLTSAQVTNYAVWDILRLSNNFKVYRDTVLEAERSDTDYIPTVDLNCAIHSHTSGLTGYFDWILVRKYQAAEPAFSSAGSEETIPSSAIFMHAYRNLRET